MKIIFPNIKIERWKYNKEYQIYVSNMGHFRNRDKAPIAPKVNPSGYLVILCKGSTYKWVMAHRLVMLTWCPTIEAEDLTVDHLDHNKRNNELSNLEWVSLNENRKRAERDILSKEQMFNDMVREIKNKAKDTAYKKVLVFSGKNMLNYKVIYSDTRGLQEAIDAYTVKTNPQQAEALTRAVNKLFDGTNNNGHKKIMGLTLILV